MALYTLEKSIQLSTSATDSPVMYEFGLGNTAEYIKSSIVRSLQHRYPTKDNNDTSVKQNTSTRTNKSSLPCRENSTEAKSKQAAQ